MAVCSPFAGASAQVGPCGGLGDWISCLLQFGAAAEGGSFQFAIGVSGDAGGGAREDSEVGLSEFRCFAG